jgi:hypothetical protein
MVVACAVEHRGSALVHEPDDAAELDPHAWADAGIVQPDNADAASSINMHAPVIDCGTAGLSIWRFDPSGPREVLCRSFAQLVALDGGMYKAEAGDASCPTSDQLRWPGGGETCWWSPVCDSVETRAGDAGLECCYDVQQMCGV